MVASVTSALDDGIHISTPDLKRLGHEMALLARSRPIYALNREKESALPQPVFIRRDGNLIRIGFSGGKGGLHAPGRISGFTIHDATGAPVPLIYRAEIDPSEPTVIRLYLDNNPPAGATNFILNRSARMRTATFVTSKPLDCCSVGLFGSSG